MCDGLAPLDVGSTLEISKDRELAGEVDGAGPWFVVFSS
jgi:hypothetical protein